MINLLPPHDKKEIRAARRNVLLGRYLTHILALNFLIAIVFGAGFWIAYSDKTSAEARIAAQNDHAKDYTAVQKQAKEFRDNLLTAQKVLDKGVPYSTFLTTLAKDKPGGTIINSLRLGGPAAAKQTAIEISARASTYEKAIELKAALEKSELFEDVSLLSVDRPPNIDKLSGIAQTHPFDVRLKAKLSAVTLEPGGL